MKAFTVRSGSVTPGIQLSQGSVVVGEKGRPHKQVTVPVPAGAQASGGRLEESPGAAGGALVLVCDHSGFRGGWTVRDARTDAEWDLILRRRAAHRPPDGTGPLAEGHRESFDKSCAACDAVGTAPANRPASWRVVAEGWVAQGDAGRAGGGPEYLAVLGEGRSVELVRTGRLYGKPDVIRLTNRGGEVVADFPRDRALTRKAEMALRPEPAPQAHRGARYVMNSAVMTGPGLYRYELVTAEFARGWAATGFESAVGYAQTAEALSLILGLAVPVDRRNVALRPGDEALVFRIALPEGSPRIDPADKGRLEAAVLEGHFELGLVRVLE